MTTLRRPQVQALSAPVAQQKQLARSSPSGPAEWFSVDQTIDFASVASVVSADQAIAVAGTVVGDTVLCTPLGVWIAGVSIPMGRCLVDGTVQFRITNPTAGAVDPASGNMRLIIIRPRIQG